ncbi:TNF receptor-associated factor 6-like [Amblyomma americanum]
MPPAAAAYTLVGFSPDLDWRPLSFVKTIPTNRVCSACGLVRKKTALLSCCMHVLCDSCYEQCDQEGSHVCPLDGHEWLDEDDVEWRDLPPEQLLRREVKCWNAKHGCGTVVEASLLSQHSQQECRHHSARCPMCSASVLCSDVCAHLRSDCTTPSTPPAPESGHQMSNTEGAAPSTSFQRVIQQETVEMRTNVGQLVTDVKCHDDRLSEVSHGINTFKEVMRGKILQVMTQIQESVTTGVHEIASDNEQLKKQLITWNDNFSRNLKAVEEKIKHELAAGKREIYDSCSQIAAYIHEKKGETLETSEKTVDRVKTLLPSDEPQGEHVIIDVKGVKSLEEKALKKGWAAYETDQVYLCGYCISPGVEFVRDSQSMHLHVRMLLQKGDNDDAIEWPFQHKIRMGIIDQREGVARFFVEIKPHPECTQVQKPTTSSNPTGFFPYPSFNLRVIRDNGYVYKDTLRIKWEVLP